MRRASIATAALLLALTAGCSSSEPQPRIDPTTPETTASSIAEVQSKLSEAKREEFTQALAIVIPNAMGGGYRDVGDTDGTRARVQEALRDKTADDIIAAAAMIRESTPTQQP